MAVRPLVSRVTSAPDAPRTGVEGATVDRRLIALAIVIAILSVGLLYAPYVVNFLLH